MRRQAVRRPHMRFFSRCAELPNSVSFLEMHATRIVFDGNPPVNAIKEPAPASAAAVSLPSILLV